MPVTRHTAPMSCETTCFFSFRSPSGSSPLNEMSKLAKDLSEVQRFVSLYARSTDATQSETFMRSQCQMFMSKLKNFSIAVPDASECMELIHEGPWTPTLKQELSNAVAQATAPVSVASGSLKLQTLLDVEHYMPKSLWDTLEDDSLSEKAKLSCFCQLLARIGLAHPSERTIQYCSAKFWLKVMGPTAMTMPASSKLACSKDLKFHLRKIDAAKPWTPSFPTSPAAWKLQEPDLYQQVYGAEGPCLSRLDARMSAECVQGWPMRSSNAEVRGTGPRHLSTSLPSNMDAMFQMFGMFNQYMQRASTQASPMIQILPPRSPLALDNGESVPMKAGRGLAEASSRALAAISGASSAASPTFPPFQPVGPPPTTAPSSSSTGTDLKDEKTAARNTIDDIEKEMKEAIHKRAEKKR